MSTAGEYVALGYTGIVIVQHEWSEERSGYQNEHTRDLLVCRDRSGKPCRVTIHSTYKTMSATNEHDVERSEPLSEEEYAAIVAQHGPVLDDAAFYAKRKRAADAQTQLDALRPPCPKCSRSMRAGLSRAGKRFWGCVAFPRCKGTRSISAATLAKIVALEAAGAR